MQGLEKGGNDPAGGELYVFTDGGENQSPRIKDVRSEVLTKKVKVFGLLLISVIAGHDLITLSVDSGGKSCIYSDNGTDYYDCLNNLYGQTSSTSPVEVGSQILFPF